MTQLTRCCPLIGTGDVFLLSCVPSCSPHPTWLTPPRQTCAGSVVPLSSPPHRPSTWVPGCWPWLSLSHRYLTCPLWCKTRPSPCWKITASTTSPWPTLIQREMAWPSGCHSNRYTALPTSRPTGRSPTYRIPTTTGWTRSTWRVSTLFEILTLFFYFVVPLEIFPMKINWNWNFSHEKFESLYARTVSSDRVALPNLN